MNCVHISNEFGIVIRHDALRALGLEKTTLLELLEFTAPLDSNEQLFSIGPCFGGEAADELSRRLEGLGLRYIDDFFVFSGDFPDWCEFKAKLRL